MIKKLMLLATMAMALTGFAASMAQGEAGIQWRDHGAVLGADAKIELTGKLKFSNATIGGFDCPSLVKVTLTKGTSTADITSISIENTAECVLNGLLNIECESVVAHEYTNLPWHGTGTKTGKADITGVSVHVTVSERSGHLHCPGQITVESSATANVSATLDSTATATKATFGGQVTATNAFGGHFGAMNVTGTLNVLAPNSATYGIG